MRASACAVWLGLGVLVSCSAAGAEPAASDEPGPDLELLEYLGDLVSEHDRWVGPEDMQGVVDVQESPPVFDGAAAADAEQVR